MNERDSGHPPPAMSRNQRRMSTILQRIPNAREQLLVAMEELGDGFPLQALISSAESSDPRERNKIAAIEREYEVLLNWLNELAARALAEGQRIDVVEKGSGPPWERLAKLGAISSRTATLLQEAMEMRDDLAHAYPPATWKTLHEGVLTLLDEMDRYIDRLVKWAHQQQILPSAEARTRRHSRRSA